MAEAKPIIKNKFWIVEEDGKKIGTIQSAPDGVVLVQGSTRKKFPTFKILSAKNNIHAGRLPRKSNKKPQEIYDFPCDSTPYNPVYDLKLRLPLFTKEPNSKSQYCAGYYLVEINDTIAEYFCPKKIILFRNRYHGPFRTKAEMAKKMSEIH